MLLRVLIDNGPRGWLTLSITCTVNDEHESRCFRCQAVSCLHVVVDVPVLRCVPPEHEHAVYGGGVVNSETAVQLPTSLLSKWIAFSTGDIDLRSVRMSSEQWVKLLAAIDRAPPGAVESLHVRLQHDGAELMAAMTALQNIVAHTTHLQFLGLHLICPRAENLPHLQQLFSECPGSLEKLLLDTDGIKSLGVQEKTSFYAAVAQVSGLRELHMPQWTVDTPVRYNAWGTFVSFEHPEACHPLRSIPDLKIFVGQSDLGNAAFESCFPPGLDFHGSY